MKYFNDAALPPMT